ncbi:MAG: DUF262 domain-containing protein [Chloroflexi bacterium]|nr:MAG: DUF262 domain-containing protein [Chloroflexota bacterium]MBL1197257.1 DUF262 domain-containing protein [Chloroflexota bacterium]NOH14550.1 DUF262 domain-containing protein [Chloroflexota bacterium]
MEKMQVPKPNTQALSWFYGEYTKGTLILNPKYQRNPIWSIGQKCFLIDSLISGAPIPQVFINIITKGAGTDRETSYEVVDGQQRLRAIVDFVDDKYSLVSTTAKSYPVSEIYKPHIKKVYSELPADLQNTIWDYQMAVQELRGWSEEQIRALFRRLNYVVERLNHQELRHSQYFGQFVDAVETLAEDPFWDEINLFTRRDSQRMKDVEYISELFIIMIDGVQNQQKTLDEFYAQYDVSFPGKRKYLESFQNVISSLRTIGDLIKDTRFKKKADFYGLFASVAELNMDSSKPVDLQPAKQKLLALHEKLDMTPPDELRDIFGQYYSTVIEGPNKLAKRNSRVNILLKMLRMELNL